MFRTGAIAFLFCSAISAQVSADTFTANHKQGEYYVKRGDLRSAIPYLRRAFELDPHNYDNGYDLALACLQTRALDEARGVIERLQKLGEKSELHNLLGDVEEASGHTLEAVREYEIAARADPSERNIFDLGTELLNHAGYQQAIQIFEYGIGRFPKSARLRVGIGVAYYSVGRYTDAVTSLCAAVDLDPADTRALEFLGKMNDVSPELAGDVSRRLARFAELYPRNAAANYYYALSLRGRAKSGQIESLLTRAIDADPEMADAHYQLGILYQGNGEIAKAIRELERATQLRPDFKAAHYRLSMLYRSQGQEERARDELRIVRSLDKD
jgi:tetratricopeptide (TPR) repeat protein